MNPDITIVPVFGVAQTISFPIPKLPKRYREIFDWTSCRSRTLFKITEAINKEVESFRRQNQLNKLSVFLQNRGLKLYCDFTPIGKTNQDLAIINWFSREGKNLDFDFAVYFEYDVFTTKTIDTLYKPYLHFNAGFVDYREAEPRWTWIDRPPGSKESVCNWLKTRGAEQRIYGGFFPGHFLSRKVLQTLTQQKLPNGFCEMRLPSVITGLGFSVANLDFPQVHRTINPNGILEPEIKDKADNGIFHPVYGDFDFDC